MTGTSDGLVTFSTPEGTEVTCELELAQSMGYVEPKKAPAKKAALKSEK